MSGIAIFGAGGHGKVVCDIFAAMGQEVAGFVDARLAGSILMDRPVVSDVAELAGVTRVVVAIGDNRARARIFSELRNNGHSFAQAVHPNAVLSQRSRIGAGVMICAGVIVNVDTVIGDNVILNTGASIDHDNSVADHVHVAPGCALGGGVTVNEGAFLGIGTRVIPGRTIGAWSLCGAGSVVIRDVGVEQRVVGVPARALET